MNNHKVNFFINLTHGCMILLFILALTSCVPTRTTNVNGEEVEVKSDKVVPDVIIDCVYGINKHNNKYALKICTIGDTTCYDTGYKGGISCIKN